MSERDLRPDQPEGTADAPVAADVLDGSGATPEADLYEQRRDLVDAESADRIELPDDADPADAYEQGLVVEYDEDDYR